MKYKEESHFNYTWMKTHISYYYINTAALITIHEEPVWIEWGKGRSRIKLNPKKPYFS